VLRIFKTDWSFLSHGYIPEQMRFLINYFQHQLARLYKPRIIWGYRRPDNVFLKNTRVANTTFIDGIEGADISDHVFIGHHNFLEATHGLKIGEGVQITNFVSITTHSSHKSIRLYGRHFVDCSVHKGYERGSVEIGAYCFIGPHSLIRPGTKIGKGCLIAAYSNLSGEYPDFSIIKGDPAIVVGDTRTNDHHLLSKNPELQSYYDEWAKG
jgi:acetyltransferase-like isoleucine patch superfamily enzyme